MTVTTTDRVDVILLELASPPESNEECKSDTEYSSWYNGLFEKVKQLDSADWAAYKTLSAERLLTLARKKQMPVSVMLSNMYNVTVRVYDLRFREWESDSDSLFFLQSLKVEIEEWRKVFPSEDLSEATRLAGTVEDALRETNIVIEDAEEIISTVDVQLENIKNDFSQAKSEILNTVLTVLGLFVAVIIAVVAVYLNGVADKSVLSLPLRRQILLAAFRWHATFLLIFFLIFLIAKLTGRSLAGMCKDADAENKSCDCSVCGKTCRKTKQIRKRFPWLVVLNIAFFCVEFSALYVEIHGW